MEKIVIGIDGGGTKTKAIAINSAGSVVAESSASGMNYNFIPLEEAVKNACEAIRGLKLNQPVCAVGIGDASLDDETKNMLTIRFVENLRKMIGISDGVPIHIKSDAFMALYGLTGGKPGVLIISGTGSMGVGMDSFGNMYTVGGWGNPSTDAGSGYDIAVRALCAVFNATDGVGPATSLTEKALSFFNVDKPRELINIFNSADCKHSDIASFTPVVAQCAQNNDVMACSILKQAAQRLAEYACSLLDKIGECNCLLGMYGGIFQHNEMVRKLFIQQITSKFSRVSIIFPKLPPEMAAARYALDKMN